MSSTHHTPRASASRRFWRPTVALVAIAVPAVAAGIFALSTGNDVAPVAQTTTGTATTAAASESTTTSTSDAKSTTPTKVTDPVAASRKSLQAASLPIGLLSGGVTQLTDGGKQLDGGVGQLSDGLTLAHDGSIQLADGMTQLNDGVTQLGDGAQQISGGVEQIVDRLDTIGTAQAGVTKQLADAASTVASFPVPGSADVAAQIRQLIDTLNVQGIGPDTVAQLQLLKSGSAQLSSELSDPSSQFRGGMNQATAATGQLRDGLGQLDDGGKQLKAGTGQLVSAVGPITGVVSSIQTNVTAATSALPKSANGSAAAASDATNSDAGVSDVAASSATGSASVVPYLVAAVIALGAVGMAWQFRRRSVAAIGGAVALGVIGAVVYGFAHHGVQGGGVQGGGVQGSSAGIGALISAGVFLIVGAAAYLAAAAAVCAVFGRKAGMSINFVAALVQLVVLGVAYFSSTGSIFGNAANFMPLNYVATGVDQLGSSAMTTTGWLSVVVIAATLIVSAVVLNRSSSEPELREPDLRQSA